jgi:hypothetical protein
MMIEGSGSIPLVSGSGSGSWRPKNMWIQWIQIRIQIRNTVEKVEWRHLTRQMVITRDPPHILNCGLNTALS